MAAPAVPASSIDRVARVIRTYRSPRRAVIGTVGLPGERTFYLQVDDPDGVLALRVEKQQVATLAEQILRAVQTLAEQGIVIDHALPRDDAPLSMPVEEEFTVVSIGLFWNSDIQRMIMEYHALSEAEPADFGDDDEDAADTVRLFLTLAEAKAFADRALAVVSAGRPECPLCQMPLDPEGHICPRANGYRRRV